MPCDRIPPMPAPRSPPRIERFAVISVQFPVFADTHGAARKHGGSCVRRAQAGKCTSEHSKRRKAIQYPMRSDRHAAGRHIERPRLKRSLSGFGTPRVAQAKIGDHVHRCQPREPSPQKSPPRWVDHFLPTEGSGGSGRQRRHSNRLLAGDLDWTPLPPRRPSAAIGEASCNSS